MRRKGRGNKERDRSKGEGGRKGKERDTLPEFFFKSVCITHSSTRELKSVGYIYHEVYYKVYSIVDCEV